MVNGISNVEVNFNVCRKHKSLSRNYEQSTRCGKEFIHFTLYINIYGVGGVWVQLLGGQKARSRVILVLCECIRNTAAVSLVLPAIDDSGSLGSPPRQGVYPPASMVPPLMSPVS